MKTCPRCHEKTLDERKAMNSLSRRDNSTYICPDCGAEEAMIDDKMMPENQNEIDFKIYLGI